MKKTLRKPAVKHLPLFCLLFALGCGSPETDGQPAEPPASAGPDAQPDVETHDEDGMTALHRAAIDRDARHVRKLLDAGADVHARSNEGNTPLHGAAFQGNCEVVRLLLDAGADVNAVNRHGESVLHVAVYGDQTEAVRLLLEAGAAVNVRTNDGDTPLDWADDQSIETLLRDHGAKGDGTRRRTSPNIR